MGPGSGPEGSRPERLLLCGRLRPGEDSGDVGILLTLDTADLLLAPLPVALRLAIGFLLRLPYPRQLLLPLGQLRSATVHPKTVGVRSRIVERKPSRYRGGRRASWNHARTSAILARCSGGA